MSTILQQSEVRRIAVAAIDDPPGGSAREWFGEGGLAELAESLSSEGLRHPILVRPVEHGRYELVAGSRRLVAARRLGWVEVEARIEAMTTEDAMVAGLVADLAHEPMTLLERSWLTVRLRDCLRAAGQRCSYPVLAARLGVGKPTISEYLNIAEAIPRPVLVERARVMGVSAAEAATLPRRVLREIRSAPEHEREMRLDTALFGLAAGRDGAEADEGEGGRAPVNQVRVEQDGSRLRLQLVLETPVEELAPETVDELAEALAPALPLLEHLGVRTGFAGGSPQRMGVRRANLHTWMQAWWRRWIAGARRLVRAV